MLGVILAVFALWIVPELARSAAGRPGDGAGAAQAPPEPPVEPPVGPAKERPAGAGGAGAAPDGTAERYRSLLAGDCLLRSRAGQAAPEPRRVPCGDPAAFLRVDDVIETPPTAAGSGHRECPRGPGLTDWVHRGADGGTVALCLRREFRAGECFAAEVVADGDGHAVRDADLRTGHTCGESGLSEPWTATLVITDVRPAPAAEGPVDCALDAGDRRPHWYWIVGGGDTLLCATLEPPAGTR